MVLRETDIVEGSRFVQGFVPMAYRGGSYEVLLRGSVRVPEEAFRGMRVTAEYVLCCYRSRDYAFNRPTAFSVPATDGQGREYVSGWAGFCVWAEAPLRLFRIYDAEGDTLYLKYGHAYYKSTRMRFPVGDRKGVSRRLRLWPVGDGRVPGGETIGTEP